MSDREKAIKGLEWILADDRFGFGINWETGEPRDDYEKAGKIISDTIALLKEQEERIKELESMTVSASGNGVAIGAVRGGLVIQKQTAKEIHNVKHVDVMNL